jgi:hypothetical protein
MHAYRIVWEDEPKAREIEILVYYTREGDQVTALDVRPIRVTLYDRTSGHATRELRVHTPTGRRLLADAYLASRETEQTLEDEILAAHALLNDAIGAGAAA